MKWSTAFRLAVGMTAFSGCAASIIAATVLSAHYLGRWVFAISPVALVGFGTCMMKLMDWATEPD